MLNKLVQLKHLAEEEEMATVLLLLLCLEPHLLQGLRQLLLLLNLLQRKRNLLATSVKQLGETLLTGPTLAVIFLLRPTCSIF